MSKKQDCRDVVLSSETLAKRCDGYDSDFVESTFFIPTRNLPLAYRLLIDHASRSNDGVVPEWLTEAKTALDVFREIDLPVDLEKEGLTIESDYSGEYNMAEGYLRACAPAVREGSYISVQCLNWERWRLCFRDKKMVIFGQK